MRAALFAICLVGCSTDPCDPYGGQTCIALEVKSLGAQSIDQLAISVDMILPRQFTPGAPRIEPVPLPVWVAILPGETFPNGQELHVEVDAFLNRALVGQALGALTMHHGDHVSAAITLTDLTNGSDLAGRDFSGTGLPDLSRGPSSPAFFAANNGLFGGDIEALLTDFASGSVYAGSSGAGIFKSTNAGSSWLPVNNGLDLQFVNFLASDDIDGTIYASGERKDRSFALFKTTNSASSWSKVTELTAMGPIVAARDSFATLELLVGLPDGGGVLRSTDGVNFTPKNVGLTDPKIISLVNDVINKGTVYAGTATQKVFKTTNFGDAWSDISSGITVAGGLGTRALALDPHTQDLVAATGAGLFVRPFGQSTFTAYTPTPPNIDPRALAFVPSATPDFYVGGFPGIGHLDGNKTAWSNASSGLADLDVASLSIDRTSFSLLYAGTLFAGVHVSSNGGSSWTPSSSGITNLSMLTLAIDRTNPQTVFGGSQHAGVFKSNDGGTTWSPINTGLPAAAGIVALAVNGSTVVAATEDTSASGTTQAIFHSTNGGSSWTQADANQSFALAIDPSNVLVVYAGTANGVRKSTDNGASFSAAGSIPSLVASLVVDPTNSQILYAGTSSMGVFKSGDGGQSWNPATTGISETQINCLAIDPATPTRLWASGFQSLYRSTDAATSWQGAAAGATGVGWDSIRYAGNSILYTLSSAGVFRSADAGQSWTPLAGGTVVGHDLAVDSSNADVVYFAEIGGVGVEKTLTGGI